jgi:hypothetical protein
VAAESKVSTKERRVWVAAASSVLLATFAFFLVASLQVSSTIQEVEEARAEVTLVRSELSSFEEVLAEYDQASQAMRNCEQKFENLSLARSEYLVAGTVLLEEFYSMIEYGIFAGDTYGIFIGVPQIIQGGQDYVRTANGYEC